MHQKHFGKTLVIREVGDPILRKKCDNVKVENINLEIMQIIEDMKATLDYYGGFGIAAPQIGVNKNIIIIQIEKEKCKYKDAKDFPTTIMINPVWKKISDDTEEEYEGCLSVPSISGKVKRYKNIELTYYNEKGEKITIRVSGFTARDIQHECDHLNGVVFLDKVINNNFATKSTIGKYKLQ